MSSGNVRVQRLLSGEGAVSWTLVDDDGMVGPAERFLAHLTAIERSPNTVRAYAHDLRDFFEFLAARGLVWDLVRLEDIGRFVAWLRLPLPARSGLVGVLPSVEATLRASTVNRKLSALSSFYEFHGRHGVELADLLTRWRPGGRSGGSWKPFLAHLGSRDERRRTVPAGVESLRERSAAEWLEVLGWCDRKSVARRFLTDTLGWLDDLSDGVGWHSEFDRDVWQLRRLGYPHRDARLRFEPIEAVWLRQLTKRWARWRLSTGISPSTVSTGVVAVSRLAEAFPQLRRGPEAFSRELLERHLAHLAERYPNPKGRAAHISAIASLLRAVRQHDWEPRLPATTEVYREDYPRLDEPAPRAISEAVMAQLESPANLERFTDAQARVLAEILMRTGLRVGDGCRLAIDCVVRDQHGAPYLRYRNHKMRRDALVPLDDRLAETIAEQQQATQARFPAAGHLLVREKRNPDGRLNYSADTFRNRLTAWLTDCNVRDELGRPVHVTPHQWRHTYATRLTAMSPKRSCAACWTTRPIT